MNEPLTSSTNKINFTGKTYNKHPHWFNQPLRLTKEQKKDPLPVLDDFFECYHLNEIRKILWEWLTEVLSSPHSIAIEHHDRSNHVYFYEKIEGVIEAAFVMKNRIHKHRRRQEKRKFKKSNLPEQNQSFKIQRDINSAIPKPVVETIENEEVFNKCKQLIEYADDAPLYVIDEVFKIDRLAYFCGAIRDWFDMAMLADSGIYEDPEQRRQLYIFHDQLQVLVEALFIIRTQHTKKAAINAIIPEADKTRLLSRDQIAHPLQVITAFFEKFPSVYIMRELSDWLDAGIGYSGPRPDNLYAMQVVAVHRNVLCLIKSAERLLNKREFSSNLSSIEA